jgi:hypothetical protein
VLHYFGPAAVRGGQLQNPSSAPSIPPQKNSVALRFGQCRNDTGSCSIIQGLINFQIHLQLNGIGCNRGCGSACTSIMWRSITHLDSISESLGKMLLTHLLTRLTLTWKAVVISLFGLLWSFQMNCNALSSKGLKRALVGTSRYRSAQL